MLRFQTATLSNLKIGKLPLNVSNFKYAGVLFVNKFDSMSSWFEVNYYH